MNSKHQELISRYNRQLASDAELAEIEQLILSGEIELDELHDVKQLEERISAIEDLLPSARLDNQFYNMLSDHLVPTSCRRQVIHQMEISLPEIPAPRSFVRSNTFHRAQSSTPSGHDSTRRYRRTGHRNLIALNRRSISYGSNHGLLLRRCQAGTAVSAADAVRRLKVRRRLAVSPRPS